MSDEVPTDADVGRDGSSSADAGGVGPRSSGLNATEVDRLFSVLETAVDEGNQLDTEATDRLLSVLEAAVVTPTQLDTEEIDQLFSVLESTVMQAPDTESANQVLSVLEAAITDPVQIDGTESEGLLSVLEAALVDPTDPAPATEDVFSLLDSALGNATDGEESNGVASLFSAAGLDPDDVDRTADNVFALFNPASRRDADSDQPAADGWDPNQDANGDWSNENVDPYRIARIAAAATQRSTEYSLRSGIRTGTSMVRAASTAESPADLMDEVSKIAYKEMSRLGLDVGDSVEADEEWGGASRVQTKDVLQERGSRLLEMSADVTYDEEVHPSYPRILDSMAADEARILRLLATEGPQPSIDVRDVGWVPISSELIGAGLTMIGSEAGLSQEDRTHAYMNNLYRLGLLWFSDEPVDDIKRYQVLEAQPAVEAAIEQAKRARTIYRSVHLTPFGVDFCRVCMPFEVTAEDASSVYETPERVEE
ncbi:Abi-alpha family protein [Halorientalis brevis]|uniref:Abi-alpha family protein n=1 Tax=Halorientalis brevis TaxID=1126241 RepID=A0ABD6CHR0_9EURY|nr:Abi-alpha family protein [Halorientalis brevis]